MAEDLRRKYKTCSTCKLELPVSEFSRNSTSGSGLRSNCKECARGSKAKWHAANKDRTLSNTRRRRAALRVKYTEAKNNPCVDCGLTYHSSLMHFDHTSDDKDMSVSRVVNQTMSWERTLIEINKCDLVCVMCHGVRTWNREHPDDKITGAPII